MKGSDTFTVQASVLRKALRVFSCIAVSKTPRGIFFPFWEAPTDLTDQQRHAFRNKVPNSNGIPIQIAASETLVSTVEESEMLSFQHHRGDLVPLFWGGVNTGRVVSACMEEEDGTCGSLFES